MPYSTRQRTAISEVLQKAKQPLTPVEIHQQARAQVPSLGIATVYRTLKELSGEGEVKVIDVPGVAPHYESASRPHHHFFVCEQCERLFELMGCAGGVLGLAPEGFEVERHEIVLFGRCDRC